VRNSLNALRWGFLLLATLFVAGVIQFGTQGAGGLTSNAGPLTVTATPVVNLSDGQAVNVHLEAASGTVIFSVTAHTCVSGKVGGEHSFGFGAPFCPNTPIGTGQVEQLTAFSGVPSADFRYTVGAGTVNWTDEAGFPSALTCGPDSPCDMVLKVEITNDRVGAKHGGGLIEQPGWVCGVR